MKVVGIKSIEAAAKVGRLCVSRRADRPAQYKRLSSRTAARGCRPKALHPIPSQCAIDKTKSSTPPGRWCHDTSCRGEARARGHAVLAGACGAMRCWRVRYGKTRCCALCGYKMLCNASARAPFEENGWRDERWCIACASQDGNKRPRASDSSVVCRHCRSPPNPSAALAACTLVHGTLGISIWNLPALSQE